MDKFVIRTKLRRSSECCDDINDHDSGTPSAERSCSQPPESHMSQNAVSVDDSSADSAASSSCGSGDTTSRLKVYSLQEQAAIQP